MREHALGPRPKRRFVLTTRSEKGQEVAENLLDRNFEAAAVNRVWVSHITYVATSEGWMYLCTVLDLYSRRVVRWSLSSCVDTELVIAAVAMAVIRRRPPRGLMFHSDRGVQYTSGQFKAIAEAYGFIQSMSRRRDCWDNACAETFFKTLRAELIRARSTEARRRPGHRYSNTWRSSTIASDFILTSATSHRPNMRSLRSGRRRDERSTSR